MAKSDVATSEMCGGVPQKDDAVECSQGQIDLDAIHNHFLAPLCCHLLEHIVLHPPTFTCVPIHDVIMILHHLSLPAEYRMVMVAVVNRNASPPDNLITPPPSRKPPTVIVISTCGERSRTIVIVDKPQPQAGALL